MSKFEYIEREYVIELIVRHRIAKIYWKYLDKSNQLITIYQLISYKPVSIFLIISIRDSKISMEIMTAIKAMPFKVFLQWRDSHHGLGKVSWSELSWMILSTN